MENEENSTDADLIYVGEEYIDQEDANNVVNVADETEYISFENNPEDVNEIECSIYSESDAKEFVDVSENKDDPNGNGKVENLMVVDEWDDDDLDQDEDDEGEENYDKDALNPEEVERAQLNMPTMKILMDDVGHLKQNRKVIISPISMVDFNNDLLQSVVSWTTLEEIKVAYARNYQDDNSMVGILMLHFNTSTSASNAVEYLKDLKEGISIKLDTNSHRLMEDFLDNVRSKKRWTDNVAVLKNLTNDVTVESIKELFPNVEDVVLHPDPSFKRPSPSSANKESADSTTTTTTTQSNADNTDGSATPSAVVTTAAPASNDSDDTTTITVDITENMSQANDSNMEIIEATTEATKTESTTTTAATTTTTTTATTTATSSSASNVVPSTGTSHTPKGYAYLIFSNEDVMKAEVVEAASKKMELCGHRVMLVAYRVPVHSIPRSYLRLKERKVIMKHMEKCQAKLEAAKSDGSTKAVTKLEERIQQCQSVIERDDKCRKDMDLECPSLEEIRQMTGLPPVDSKSFQKILIRFGIIKEKRKKSPARTINSSSSNDRRRSNVKEGGAGDRRTGRGSHNNGGRKSPYNKNRRSPYNNNSNSNRNKRSWGSSNNYGGNRGQRSGGVGRNMQPQSLLGSGSNIVNPLSLLMQPNLGILGSGNVLNQSMLMQSAAAAGMGGMLNPGAGLLGAPYSALGGLGVEENKNKLIRLDATGNFRPANIGGGMGGSNRYDDRNRRMDNNRFRDSAGGNRRKSRSPGRSRQPAVSDFDSRGVDDDSSIPVNMLLSLSQMLSQKMDQKRQQIERRGGQQGRDYRNSQH